MRSTYQELIQFTLDYAEEDNLQPNAAGGELAGDILQHTIGGHDLSWGLEFVKMGNTESTTRAEFRLRERDFEPFLTVWGTKTQMRDFSKDQLEAAKEYIKDCIHKAAP